MYFNKIRHPANFAFADHASAERTRLTLGKNTHRVVIDHVGADVHRVCIKGPHVWINPSQAELTAPLEGAPAHRVELKSDGALVVTAIPTGTTLLSGVPGATFGTSGDAWMLQFRHTPGMRFYGLGEHSSPGIEKSGQRVKFWNTDVWGDFHQHQIDHAHPNPMYVAIPWLIVKQGDTFIGLLVNHPGAVFMDLASNFIWEKHNPDDKARRSFYVGAPDGAAEVFIIVGPDLAALTRKLQTLVGRTPRPPLWALGHHQFRWGYAGPDDLRELDSQFTRHRIPTDGLWLDIDYMDRYKVFTFGPKLWGDEKKIRKILAALAKKGRRIIPILDPGVKVEPGYVIHDDGLKHDAFCLNPAGKPYVGFVWPGQTYMPDYSLPEVRDWWAAHVRRFAELGAGGAWLDMNDPAVGAVELDEMRFNRGRLPHESYHNQYALGMARASHAGFLAARPAERPFLLARSAFVSSSRYTAVWTGDNVSNWHHLRTSIPLSLNLALSGQPFNGPDVGGFSGDTTPALAVAWYKAGFLFPFFRNHSIFGSRKQEPWALGAPALRTIGRYIRLRYKLLPYLYQLFIRQEETGEAILRPLIHDYRGTPRLNLDSVSDQFLVGPDILQAPVLIEKTSRRALVLPGRQRWFSAHEGRWLRGGIRATTTAAGAATPLYVREGALIPMQTGERTTARNNLADIELHCFLRPDTRGEHRLDYVADDGLGFGYRAGEQTRVTLVASATANGVLAVRVESASIGWRPLRLRVVAYGAFTEVAWICAGRTQTFPLRPHRWVFTGKTLRSGITSAVTL
jgi:alpha-glucosidase